MASRTGWQALNFHRASQCSFTMQADILSELSLGSRPAACTCSDVPAALQAKRKPQDSHSGSIACRRTDVDMFCKDCQVVQDECGGVPWKTEQKKREGKDEKKNGHEEPNENLSEEKWRSDEKKLKTWLARMQNRHGKVKTNARVHAKASKVDDEAVLHTCILSIFPLTKSATPRNSPPPPPPGPRKDADSLPLPCSVIPVRSQGQDLDRHASLFFRSSIVRMAQMVVQ